MKGFVVAGYVGLLLSIIVVAFATRNNAIRLENLEAASTIAQQPQERHYFPDISGDSAWVLTSSDTAYHKYSESEWLSIRYSYCKEITASVR